MIKQTIWFLGLVCAGSFLAFATVSTPQQQPGEENHPPVVKILAPSSGTSAAPNSMLRYKISVTDEEDGSSLFQEISPKEVVLEIRYTRLSDTQAARRRKPDAGLHGIEASNCFTCHQFNTQSMAPSFSAIAKRYGQTAQVSTLAKHIQEGCTGIWGPSRMPSHPEVSDEESLAMVRWILKAAGNSDLNYISGLSGSFRVRPDTLHQGYALVLTARYTDHGQKDHTGKRMTGQDVIILHGP